MNLERAKVQENLPKKGFVKQDDRKHIFYHLYHDGKKTHIRTHVSHGSKYKILGGVSKSCWRGGLKRAAALAHQGRSGPRCSGRHAIGRRLQGSLTRVRRRVA